MNKIREILKRYSMAFIFLLLVIIMMLLGTLGVTSFGNKMLEDMAGVDMQPRGVHLNTNSTL
ncbi:hypothetical protein MNB_SV-15-895 [hydrothermal vent metagenome]|uniref:Uncharacterized protein n=1 Tax=hydrothermal vent metagenome TaxID=652676 RepID=A0A1W1EKC3_9ZZZZ